MSIWEWADWIEPVGTGARVSLGEGNTPLLRSRRIGPSIGLANLHFKLETNNPAGSFKDRFGAAAISHMLDNGSSRCVATSSGNTGSALAAYCAAAGIECHIAIVEPAPEGKLRQMMCYGAHIFKVRGFGLDPVLTDQTFQRLKKLGSRAGTTLQVSSYIYSAPGMTGVETISFELHEQSGGETDHVFCPAGGGGLCVAVARGYETLIRAGRLAQPPAVHCVQPEGNDTIAGPLRSGAAQAREVVCTTEVSGLQVPNVNDGHLVIEHCRPTGGTGHLVTDEDVWASQRRLAVEEGIFCEPAGATALAGVMHAAADGTIKKESNVVCLVTGTGFKDEGSIHRMLKGVECPLISPDDLEQEIER